MLETFDCAIAMSGGVDSTYTAWVMQRTGVRCIGVTLKMLDHVNTDRAISDAREAADIIGIPHRVVDVRDSFVAHIVEPFKEAYLNGITPSPCLICNPRIKWEILFAEFADSSEMVIATGHYARMETGADNHAVIHRGTHLDQSYFLSRLPGNYLRRTRFPLGNLRKSDVRQSVKDAGLPLFDRPDSQENCFIASGRYVDYLEQFDPGHIPPPGDIIDRHGTVRGRHRGVHRYTVGQRSGLGIAAPAPLYVIDLDVVNNRVIVGPKEDVYSDHFSVERCVWSGIEPPVEAMEAEVQVRYRHHAARCRIVPVSSDAQVVHVQLLSEPAVIAPGQGAAFYSSDALLGGGEIVRKSANFDQEFSVI